MRKSYWPLIWIVFLPTKFPASLDKAGPKHSTSVSFSVEVAVPLSVDVKEVALVPNPVPGEAVKGLAAPQETGTFAVLCTRGHSLLPPTLQMVIPLMSPTVHWKLKPSPGQVGGAAMSCPETLAWGTKNTYQMCIYTEEGNKQQLDS